MYLRVDTYTEDT